MFTISSNLVRRAITKQSLASFALRSNVTLSNPTAEKWTPKKWRISTAVIVERLPLLTPELSEFELKMQTLLDQLEIEQSKKCDHEIRHEEDLKLAEMKKRGEKIPAEKMLLNTAMDDEEYWRKEADKFVPASRITEDDKTNNKQSSDRCLDKSLFLLIKKDNIWTLPMTGHTVEPSLRETSEKAIKDTCGKDFRVQIIGNAPFAHLKLKYSKEAQEESKARGEKVFIYKGYYKSGALDKSLDYQWITRSELEEIIDARFKSTLLNILYDED